MSTSQVMNSFTETPMGLRGRAAEVGRSFQDLAIALFQLFCTLQASYEMRARMKNLDDRALHDVGLTKADIAAEISKPIWK